MTVRFILFVLFALCLQLSAAQRPNIIVVLTDDMGCGDVSCYGGKVLPTPNIDRMAAEGIRFTQYYSASPICSPSRTGMLTGMYPARWNILTFLHGRAGNRASGQADFLDSKAPSMARTLKESGYATAHIGKWHMGGGRDVTNAPLFSAYGFDEHVSTHESPQADPNLTATNWIWSAQDNVKRWDRTAYFVDKTLDFLRRNKDKPCFVNLWPDDVHTPWVPTGTPDDQLKESDDSREKLLPVLKEYDLQIGRLLDGIKKLGIDENTLVIFTSDNGAMPTFDGERSAGFRDGKASLHEGGIRMPFIVRWPGTVPSGRVNDKTVLAAVDLFPSFCKLAGATLPTSDRFDGEDLSAALLGKEPKRDKSLIWEFGSLSQLKATHRSPKLAIRDGKWKLLVNPDGTETELFDLSKDTGENTNLVEENPRLASRLTKVVLKWRNSLEK